MRVDFFGVRLAQALLRKTCLQQGLTRYAGIASPNHQITKSPNHQITKSPNNQLFGLSPSFNTCLLSLFNPLCG
jgi:hypothetical protein